ncbi:MAG: hypothetical protein ACK501_20170 [Planctomycetota bacterium]
MRRSSCVLLLVALAACHVSRTSSNASSWHEAAQERALAAANGRLLLVGGGLDDDTRSVYELLLEAPAGQSPHVVVATAATGPEDVEATDKSEALRAWSPTTKVSVVRRATSTADTVATLQTATSVFFTGGDQKRITERYRPSGAPTPEFAALLAVLARGGIVGGGSAGCAMMGEQMLLGGRSAQALGVPDTSGDGEPSPIGPRLGWGMGFLPGVLTDSLFVDGTFAQRAGSVLFGLRARLLGPGERLAIAPLGAAAPPRLPDAPGRQVPVVEPGQNRQLASWRLFRHAMVPGSGVHELRCDGFTVRAMPAGDGSVVFELVAGTTLAEPR